MQKKILIAFRTHYWNEVTDFLARKLYAATLNFDFVVMADETNGIIDTKHFEKVSHTSDMFSAIELPHWPASYNNLHYNGDYVLYDLRKKKPGYDFYVLVENDAIINFDIEGLLVTSLEQNIDFIAKVDEVNSSLHAPYHEKSKRWFKNTGRSFFPFVAVSSNFVDELYAKRLMISKAISNENEWPYCESFVASCALSTEGIKIINLDDIIDTSDYQFMNHKYVFDTKYYRRNSICHPVVGKEFLEKNLIVNHITALFDKKTSLYSGVKAMAQEGDFSFVEKLENIIKEKDISLLERFKDFAFSEKWIEHIPAINLALGKPATQSSVSHYSTHQSVEKDAALLVDGRIIPETKSHTAKEKNPWVQIDLELLAEIRFVVIYVRPVNFHIFNDFFISFSENGFDWEVKYMKTDGVFKDSSDLKPIAIKFKRGNFARFVRVTLDDYEALALNQIEVYSY
ncbi:discoidin domain-containing protein [Swingsia samuiensis]|uniref:Discoidin domain-containing protein n=1 Tax=Swingsia samuiensis TaxID=1293412 RepID=A0A4Y6UKQ9_9PROT|nr:discoidin domain-containing protein [Swingsia samuiensis]QDH16981.1 discoidin domain-containing protein [Swingsia samuiensis]